jgi:pyruvate dehydrogenase E1 component
MRWGFEYMQAEDGGSVALRLSTRTLDQPQREMTEALAADVVRGGYWLRPPAPGADLAIAYTGAVAPEAIAAHEAMAEDVPGAGVLAITSPERLHDDWMSVRRARIGGAKPASAQVERLLAPLAPDAAIVTVIDGHPLTLSWLGSVAGHRIYPLGVDRFGQSGDIPDLYRTYGIDADAILDAAARALVRKATAA